MSINWNTLKTAEDLQAEKYEAAAQAVRAERDKRLAATDYFMLADAPPSPEGLEAKRQALRDVTEQPGFPFNINWPEF